MAPSGLVSIIDRSGCSMTLQADVGKDVVLNWNCRFYEGPGRCIEYHLRAVGLGYFLQAHAT